MHSISSPFFAAVARQNITEQLVQICGNILKSLSKVMNVAIVVLLIYYWKAKLAFAKQGPESSERFVLVQI